MHLGICRTRGGPYWRSVLFVQAMETILDILHDGELVNKYILRVWIIPVLTQLKEVIIGRGRSERRALLCPGSEWKSATEWHFFHGTACKCSRETASDINNSMLQILACAVCRSDVFLLRGSKLLASIESYVIKPHGIMYEACCMSKAVET